MAKKKFVWVKQSREGVAPTPTPWCSSYRKGSLRVTLDHGRQLYFTYSLHVKTVLFQAVLFSISTQFKYQVIKFQVIQFSTSMHYSSISPIDRTLSGAITPSQSGPGSDGNEGGFCVPQIFSITGSSPADCLVSYSEHSLWGSYPFGEVQSVYSTAPTDWAKSKSDCKEGVG